MKLIKKVISLCMILSFVFTNYTMAWAAEENALDFSEEFRILRQLGFLNEFDINDTTVSKLQFSKAVLDLLNAGTDSMTDKEVVDTAIDMGLIKNVSSFRAKPKDSIAYEEAVYALVNALGYSYQANLAGGYPIGYMITAKGNDVLAGLPQSIKSAVDGQIAAKLLYNAAHAPYMKAVSVAHGDVQYRSGDSVTLLSEIHGIFNDRGVVEAVGLSGLYSTEGAVGEGNVKINSVIYQEEDTGAQSCLGYYVKYYYMENPNRIISISIDKSKNDVLTIKSDKLSDSTTGNTMWYENENGKAESIDITGAAVIYNGTAYPGYTLDMLTPTVGEVVLVGRHEGEYSVVNIWDYQTFWVKDFNLDTFYVYNNYGGSLALADSSVKAVDVYDEDGNTCYITDIQPNNIALIATSQDGKYIKIILSKKQIAGTIDGVTNDSTDQTITIDGVSYPVSKSYSMLEHPSKQDLRSGLSGTFYLNAFGEVAGVDKAAAGGDYIGYIIDAAYDDKSIDHSVSAKIFTQEGEMKIFRFAKDVSFDAQPKISGLSIVDKFADTKGEFLNNGVPVSKIKRQLISYNLNSKGEIKSVDLASKTDQVANESGNTLCVDYNYSLDGGAIRYRSKSNTFGGKAVITSNVVTFMVSAKNQSSEDKDYSVLGTAPLQDQKSLSIEAYSTDASNLSSEIVVLYPSGTENADDIKILVDRVTKVENDEGEVVNKLFGFETDNVTAAKQREFMPADANSIPDTISQGDFVTVHLDFKNNVRSIDVIYDYSEQRCTYPTYESTASWFAENRTVLLSVNKLNKGIIEGVIGIDPTNTAMKKELVNAAKYRSIAVFDPNRRQNKVYAGSIKDLKSYADDGNNYSIVIQSTYYGEDRGLVIYKCDSI